jgi:hypothetical protein
VINSSNYLEELISKDKKKNPEDRKCKSIQSIGSTWCLPLLSDDFPLVSQQTGQHGLYRLSSPIQNLMHGWKVPLNFR